MQRIGKISGIILIILLLSGTLGINTSRAEEQSKIKIGPVIKRVVGPEFIPGQLLVKTRAKTEVIKETEISITIPLVNKKIIFRPDGFSFKGLNRMTELNKKLKITGAEIIDLKNIMPEGNMIRVKLEGNDNASMRQAIADYSQNPEVEFAEPIYFVRAFMVPNDAYYKYQWNMKMINMESAWDKVANGGSGSVKVAVIDTGIVRTPELANVPFASPQHFLSYDCVTNLPLSPVVADTNVTDAQGHGTHVASTIAQATNNSNSATGVAYGISLMPIKALSCDGGGFTVDIIKGINFAVANGAKVINMSLGGPATTYSIAQRQAIQAAVNQGVTVVVATGNEADRVSSPAIGCPACSPEAIAVGAVRYDSIRAIYSQYTPNNISDSIAGNVVNRGVDVVAPGGQMITDDELNLMDQNGDKMADGIIQQTIVPGSNPLRYTAVVGPNFNWYCVDSLGNLILENECGNYQGTSMATPHVAGVAALMYSLKPNISPQQVKSILMTTAKKSFNGYNTLEYGAGVMDAAAALEAVIALGSPTVTPTMPTIPTATRIPTTTATPTITLTPTATRIPTLTATPTTGPSPTPTVTRILSPTPTTTGIPLATLTPTITVTRIPTNTMIPTLTPTKGPSPTPAQCPVCVGTNNKMIGDANCDGMINNDDFLIWKQEYLQYKSTGSSGINWTADFSGTKGVCDGKVDLYDFAVWKDNYLRLKL